MTDVTENPQIPGIGVEVFIPDQLIAGDLKLVTQNVLVSAGNLKRGSILGATSTAANESVAAKPATGAPNTGNATLSAISQGSNGYLGALIITMTSATAFTVTDQYGNVIGTGTLGVAFTSTSGNFTATAGATPMVAGDGFTITFEAGVGSYLLSATAAGDGSQTPIAVLANDVDATSEPKMAGAYFMGEFNARAITMGAGWTLAAIRAALAARAIYIKDSESAAEPT